MKITFGSTSGRALTKYKCILTEDTHFETAVSAQVQALILAAVELEEFNLTELTEKAIELGLATKQTDLARIGAWHRPKLIELGVITKI